MSHGFKQFRHKGLKLYFSDGRKPYTNLEARFPGRDGKEWIPLCMRKPFEEAITACFSKEGVERIELLNVEIRTVGIV